jgi:hypothetical protein
MLTGNSLNFRQMFLAGAWIASFSSSHGCLLGATLVRDVSMFATPARPGFGFRTSLPARFYSQAPRIALNRLENLRALQSDRYIRPC